MTYGDMDVFDKFDSSFDAYVQNHTEQIRFVHYRQAEADFRREIQRAHSMGFSKGFRAGGTIACAAWLTAELIRWML